MYGILFAQSLATADRREGAVGLGTGARGHTERTQRGLTDPEANTFFGEVLQHSPSGRQASHLSDVQVRHWHTSLVLVHVLLGLVVPDGLYCACVITLCSSALQLGQ